MRTVLRRCCPFFINGVIINACIIIIYSIALPSSISLFRGNNLLFSPVLFEFSVCLRLPEINQYALLYHPIQINCIFNHKTSLDNKRPTGLAVTREPWLLDCQSHVCILSFSLKSTPLAENPLTVTTLFII